MNNNKKIYKIDGKRMNERTILIIGKPSPPIGGVTIHVSRLLEYLATTSLSYNFYDLRKFSPFLFISNILKHKYVHLHSSSVYLRLLFSIICIVFRVKSIVTIHGNLYRYHKIKNLIDILTIKLCVLPIVINKYSYNIAYKINKNVQLISAYLPSIKQEKLSTEIIAILEKLKNRYKYLVVTNAFALTYDKNKNEIYGIDFLIRFFKNTSNYGFVISDPSGDYYKKYFMCISECDNIEIIGYPHPFIGILEYADIYIRYTSTDGDSLSIHEAIDAGVKVITTDVVDRPESVYLIKRDNYNELSNILLSIESKKCKTKNRDNKKPNIISFYEQLLQ
jgi:hypothetical protein